MSVARMVEPLTVWLVLEPAWDWQNVVSVHATEESARVKIDGHPHWLIERFEVES